jgi:hypothetical protein
VRGHVAFDVRGLWFAVGGRRRLLGGIGFSPCAVKDFQDEEWTAVILMHSWIIYRQFACGPRRVFDVELYRRKERCHVMLLLIHVLTDTEVTWRSERRAEHDRDSNLAGGFESRAV